MARNTAVVSKCAAPSLHCPLSHKPTINRSTESISSVAVRDVECAVRDAGIQAVREGILALPMRSDLVCAVCLDVFIDKTRREQHSLEKHGQDPGEFDEKTADVEEWNGSQLVDNPDRYSLDVYTGKISLLDEDAYAEITAAAVKVEKEEEPREQEEMKAKAVKDEPADDGYDVEAQQTDAGALFTAVVKEEVRDDAEATQGGAEPRTLADVVGVIAGEKEQPLTVGQVYLCVEEGCSGVAFGTQEKLKQHVKEEHGKELTEEEIPEPLVGFVEPVMPPPPPPRPLSRGSVKKQSASGRKRVKCDTCGLPCKPEELDRHKAMVHASPHDEWDSGPMLYACPSEGCGVKSSDPDECRQHIKNAHPHLAHYYTHTVQRRFRCDRCELPCRTQDALNEHIVKVHGDEPDLSAELQEMVKRARVEAGLEGEGAEGAGEGGEMTVAAALRAAAGAESGVCCVASGCGERFEDDEQLVAHMIAAHNACKAEPTSPQ